jgi:uncharacterized protein (TIGR02646 family)
MHKIDRTAVPIPTCLTTPAPGRSYSDLHGSETEQIRTALLQIQKHRCAYCERRTGAERDDGHIEHFRKQADKPELDLTWENLFWSCNDEKTCGKHKDKCTRTSGPKANFNSDDIANPGIDDPDIFFLFITDGTIQIRKGLSMEKERRAKETLRVFQLAESAYLRKAREDAVKPYVDAIVTLSTVGPELVRRYVESQRAIVEDAPFSTAIRHCFMSYSP